MAAETVRERREREARAEAENRVREIQRRGTSTLSDRERCESGRESRCHRRAKTYVDGKHLCGTCACREQSTQAWFRQRDSFVVSAHRPVQDDLRAAGIM